MLDLSSSDKQRLLELARKALENQLETHSLLAVPEVPASLMQLCGCFVTLRKKGDLRGCIGTFDAAQPLVENVIRMSVGAAFKDPRFPDLKREELIDLKIEISVLGPLEKIDSIDQIEIGKHGIQVALDHKRGTYLPDVAVDQGWNALEFVTYCAREKANLNPKQIAEAELHRYEVLKVTESSS